MATPREYETTHPFITFDAAVSQRLQPATWAHLGEIHSKLRHLVGTPLKPGVALHLSRVYMRRGALSSAAIEGNTLSEDQVEGLFARGEQLPESQLYLKREVENVLRVLLKIRRSAAEGNEFGLTPEWIDQVHRSLLDSLPLDEDVVPGEYREHRVGVGTYSAVPPSDIRYLVERFCAWIEEMRSEARAMETEDRRLYASIFAAVLAHLYFAWIHPYGDGNGRTARAIECAILAHSGGVPWVSTVLLSDYYNRTRSEYYRKLEAASKRGDVVGFIAYSVLGFRDELRLQVEAVQRQQRIVAWTDYVHERFRDEPSTNTTRRRRMVALAMPEGAELGRKEVRFLSPEIADAYDNTSERLFKRDMGRLVELNVVRRRKDRYVSAIDLIDAFMPRPEHGSNMPTMVMPEEYLIDDDIEEEEDD